MKSHIVSDWMHNPAITIPEDTLLPAIRATLAEHKVRRLPVVDEHGALVGIVTQGDVFSLSASHVTDVQDYNLYFTMGHVPAKEFMTRDVITATPDTQIIDVAQLMLDHKIGGLPVVDGNQVVGVITESDIFRLLIASERERDGS